MFGGPPEDDLESHKGESKFEAQERFELTLGIVSPCVSCDLADDDDDDDDDDDNDD